MLQALTLLAMALQLLVAANGPGIPESLKQQAISIANFAIKVSNEALKGSSVASISSAVTSPAPVTVVPPPAPPTDATSPSTALTPSPVPPPPPQAIYVLVPVSVSPPPLSIPTVTLSSDKPLTAEGVYIVDDGKFTLMWTSTNADSCTGYAEDYVSGYVSRGIRDPQKWGWYGKKSPSGTQVIIPQEIGDYKFWIECRNSVNSKQSERITIRIGQLSFTTPSPATILDAFDIKKFSPYNQLATDPNSHIFGMNFLDWYKNNQIKSFTFRLGKGSDSKIKITSVKLYLSKDNNNVNSVFAVNPVSSISIPDFDKQTEIKIEIPPLPSPILNNSTRIYLELLADVIAPGVDSLSTCLTNIEISEPTAFPSLTLNQQFLCNVLAK